jgi:hypothetical protein
MKFLVGNHRTYNESNANITGNHNVIYGDNNEITGNHVTVYGNNNNINGNHSTAIGLKNVICGNYGTIQHPSNSNSNSNSNSKSKSKSNSNRKKSVTNTMNIGGVQFKQHNINCGGDSDNNKNDSDNSDGDNSDGDTIIQNGPVNIGKIGKINNGCDDDVVVVNRNISQIGSNNMVFSQKNTGRNNQQGFSNVFTQINSGNTGSVVQQGSSNIITNGNYKGKKFLSINGSKSFNDRKCGTIFVTNGKFTLERLTYWNCKKHPLRKKDDVTLKFDCDDIPDIRIRNLKFKWYGEEFSVTKGIIKIEDEILYINGEPKINLREKPVKPVKPIDSKENKPIDPKENKPIEPIKPVETIKSMDSKENKPIEPIKPVETIKTIDSNENKPIEPIKKTEIIDISDSTEDEETRLKKEIDEMKKRLDEINERKRSSPQQDKNDNKKTKI